MYLSGLFFLVAVVTATLDPASSNTRRYKPTSLDCQAEKVSTAIQAAECSHNTRTSKNQTFAVFKTDHKYDSSHGAPYGTCSAYTCDPPGSDEIEYDKDSWIFYWSNDGEASGNGTACIKDPKNGDCGCENSDGTFVSGSNSCK